MRKRIIWVPGKRLVPAAACEALRRYIYRHTAEHVPNWAMTLRYMEAQGGLWTHYFEAKPQFSTDAEWLAGSEFPMLENGDFAPCWYQPRRATP